MKTKRTKSIWVFFLQYDKFSSVSIDNFIKHKPLISGGAGLLLRCVIASCWEVDIFLGRLYTKKNDRKCQLLAVRFLHLNLESVMKKIIYSPHQHLKGRDLQEEIVLD